MITKLITLIATIALMGGIMLNVSPSMADTSDTPSDDSTSAIQVANHFAQSRSNDDVRLKERAERRIENLSRGCRFASEDSEMTDIANETLSKAKDLYAQGKYSEALSLIDDLQRSALRNSYQFGNRNGYRPNPAGDGMQNRYGSQQGSGNQYGNRNGSSKSYNWGQGNKQNRHYDQWNHNNNPDNYGKKHQHRSGDCDGSQKGKRNGHGKKGSNGKGNGKRGNGNGQGRCGRS